MIEEKEGKRRGKKEEKEKETQLGVCHSYWGAEIGRCPPTVRYDDVMDSEDGVRVLTSHIVCIPLLLPFFVSPSFLLSWGERGDEIAKEKGFFLLRTCGKLV
jgi:hypothetical protein